MRIKESDYVCSVVKPEQYPDNGLPEFAFVGRSNVGKSSLINALLNRRNLAHVSAQPGKTRTLNFYLVNNLFYFVDLPGYGFAKVSQQQKNKWGEFIVNYLTKRKQLKCVCQLVDLRHAPTEDDINMYWWFRQQGIPCLLIATKADKVSWGNWPQHLKIIRQTLEIENDVPVIPFSAKTKQGREEVFAYLQSFF